jgi:hypothetical protein
MDGWMTGCLDGCVDGWRDDCLDGWVDGWMDGWMFGWMDEWSYRRCPFCNYFVVRIILLSVCRLAGYKII